MKKKSCGTTLALGDWQEGQAINPVGWSTNIVFEKKKESI
jgi:hypothetical protein